MKESQGVNVVDVFMIGGPTHRVIEVPVNKPVQQVNEYIDIRKGNKVETNG